MRYPLLAALLIGTGLASSHCSSPTPAAPSEISAPSPDAEQAATPAKVFADYLRDSFGQSIPIQGQHWYVIIPAVGCLGCAHAELRQLASTTWSQDVTVISSGLLRDLSGKEITALQRNAHLLADTMSMADNTLDRLNLPFSTLTGIVKTLDGRVVAFIPFDNDSYKKAFATLPRKKQYLTAHP